MLEFYLNGLNAIFKVGTIGCNTMKNFLLIVLLVCLFVAYVVEANARQALALMYLMRSRMFHGMGGGLFQRLMPLYFMSEADLL
uniref:Uncharacterized protein n=1 Tax=Magallana gigas TaxID=29159 RepID=K1Q044_MAGGI